MEKPVYYMLAPNVPVLKPRPLKLVEDRPPYLRRRPLSGSASMMEPVVSTQALARPLAEQL